MKSSTRFLHMVAVALLAAVCTAQAADKPKRVKYTPPTGFDRIAWGELRTSPGFAQLPATPIGVGAAFLHPVEKDLTFNCVANSAVAMDMGGPAGGCDFQATLQSFRRRFEGGGFYVLSEYTNDDQGTRYGSGADSVLMHPVVYQFCANWDSTKREVPQQFDEYNKFCGVRLMFQSETREELRKLPGDYVTNYDRVLDKLIARFGKPDGFVMRGRVVIETLEGDSLDGRERKFSIWRWCPARDRGLHTNCDASVTLSLDPGTGEAMVLYSTPLLWEYAYARRNGGFKDDRLFRILHARKR